MLDSIGRIPAEAAERFGDKPALITPGRRLSFHELNALSSRCANALVGLGVKAGDRVTLYSGNSWEWIVAYYGALKAGAVINPINVMLTPEEVGFVARDCGASVVLASHEKALSIEHIKDPSGVREIIAFGDEVLPEGMLSFGDLLAKYPEEFEMGDIDSQSLSTIAYTSGTTGHPKGACLSHRNVLLNVAMTVLMHERSSSDWMIHAPAPPNNGEQTARDLYRLGRHRLYATPFASYEAEIEKQLDAMFGAHGFDADRDIEAITMNRWAHGYSYGRLQLYDPDWEEGQAPHELGRASFGRIHIANSDSEASAYLHSAIDAAARAVGELDGPS